MPRTRTFIAVDTGDAIRKQAVALQKQLGKLVPSPHAAGSANSGTREARGANGVNWTEPTGMHVTLLFLGEVDDREVVRVCRAAAAAAKREPPFTLAVSGVGAFPNPRRPKVVWGGITDGADALKRLHAALEAAMLDLGCYRKEDRAYTPHLTLGRTTDDAAGFALAAEVPKLAGWDGGRTTVNEVKVYSSELLRSGPEYTVIARAALSGAG